MEISYGTEGTSIVVTYICYNKLKKHGIIKIPSGDNERAAYFGDPVHGVRKSIFIKHDTNLLTYDETKTIYIDTKTNEIYVDTRPDYIQAIYFDVEKKLAEIQASLTLKYGTFTEELPEQKMAVSYLTGDEKVLEIGGNIGRNSLVISTILKAKGNNNLVVLESNPVSAEQLKENRDVNNFNFFIEASALSKRKLVQQGWVTSESDHVPNGFTSVNIININELRAKYTIDFDTLVLDCEGAFYYIIMDMPEILDGIKLIIMENDYVNYDQKLYVDDKLRKANFKCVYSEKGGSVASWCKCEPFFYQVWQKNV